MKNRLTTIVLVIILCLGLGLLLYPTFSDFWNSFHQSRAISNYAEAVANLDEERYQELWDNAVAYNERLAERGNNWNLSAEQLADYNSQLDVTGTGIMAYIEIAKIGVSLPIYHGTGDDALQIAIGHIEGSSLPTGGKSTHCVLSGHRGLPSARLFTDLDQMVVGDTFVIRTLDETLTYEVDQIRIVLPNETDELLIQPGKDLCTLITCTPYGVNSHRMLVRGHRIENLFDASSIRVTGDALQIDTRIVAGVIGGIILVVIAVVSSLHSRRRTRAAKTVKAMRAAHEEDKVRRGSEGDG